MKKTVSEFRAWQLAQSKKKKKSNTSDIEGQSGSSDTTTKDKGVAPMELAEASSP